MYEMLERLDYFSKQPVIRGGEELTAAEAGLVPPIDVWIVVPTMAQGDQVWEEMKEFIPENLVRDFRMHGGRGKGWQEDEKIVWLDFRDSNGNWLKNRWRPSVKIQIKTADNPKALQTRGLDFLWINEAQDVSYEAWKKLNPMLDSAGRFGEARIEGIPADSKAHWYMKLCKAAERGELEDHSYHHATFLDNPDLSPRQIRRIYDRQKTMLKEDWERMYLAKDVEGGGGTVRKVSIAMGKSVEHDGPQKGIIYVAGLDLGRSTDPTVLLIGDKVTRNVHFALELMNVDWEINKLIIEAELRRWNCESIRVDSTGMGGDMYATWMEWQNLPIIRYTFTNPEKGDLFTNMIIAFAEENVGFPASGDAPWEKLEAQLEAFSMRKAGGRWMFELEGEPHDDYIDAFAMFLMGCDPAMEDQAAVPIPTSKQTMQPINSQQQERREPKGRALERKWARYEEWYADFHDQMAKDEALV